MLLLENAASGKLVRGAAEVAVLAAAALGSGGARRAASAAAPFLPIAVTPLEMFPSKPLEPVAKNREG